MRRLTLSSLDNIKIDCCLFVWRSFRMTDINSGISVLKMDDRQTSIHIVCVAWKRCVVRSSPIYIRSQARFISTPENDIISLRYSLRCVVCGHSNGCRLNIVLNRPFIPWIIVTWIIRRLWVTRICAWSVVCILITSTSQFIRTVRTIISSITKIRDVDTLSIRTFVFVLSARVWWFRLSVATRIYAAYSKETSLVLSIK